MALSFNYTQLLAALQDWPEDDDADYVAAIPQIIAMGELRVLRDLGLEGKSEVVDTTDFVSGDPEVEQPDNMVAPRDIFYVRDGQEIHMVRETPDWVRAYNAMGATGNPRYYAEDRDGVWIVAPKPDFSTSNGGVSVRLIRNPTGLSASAPTATTWLSSQLPDLLFAACLVVAFRYLKNDPKWAAAKREYDLLIADVRPTVANLKRVTYEDNTIGRGIIRDKPSEGDPQNQ